MSTTHPPSSFDMTTMISKFGFQSKPHALPPHHDSMPFDISGSNPLFQHVFHLPIEYLHTSERHSLGTLVIQDVEYIDKIAPCMFHPSHLLSKQMIPIWSQYFTSNLEFLQETQDIITSMLQFHTQSLDVMTDQECHELLSIWKSIKCTDNFLEHYCYVDWECLLPLNRSSTFLQLISMANLSSPLLSFCIPIVLLLIPFFLLRIQRIPITFSCYCTMLQDIAKNHFLGKFFSLFTGGGRGNSSISMDKLFYVLLMMGIYVLQMVQNTQLCLRFYNNLHHMNTWLLRLQTWFEKQYTKIQWFVDTHWETKLHHRPFLQTMIQHQQVLKTMISCIQTHVSPTGISMSKMMEIGSLLSCFYEFHSNAQYEITWRYLFGLEGYLTTLDGIWKNISHHGHVHFATLEGTFNKNNTTNHEDETSSKQPSPPRMKLVQQTYPPLLMTLSSSMNSESTMVVSNTCSLQRNMIFTGPNASGKTTLLKTTLLNIIFTQQLGCGFYKACHLPQGSRDLYTHIHSYLNIPDTSERDSLFQAEARRCKDIMECITMTGPNARHFCIFDELYSGTNPVDATKTAYAFLSYLSTHHANNVTWMLTTHYTNLCKRLKNHTRCRNYRMQVQVAYPNTCQEQFHYTYCMEPGISKLLGAKHILQMMEYPKEILQQFSIGTRLGNHP